MTKTLLLTAALIGGIALPALAYQPHQGVTLREFVEARGCTMVQITNSNAFYVRGPDGGGCAAVAEFTPYGSRLVDPDGIPNSGDERYVRDN